MENLTASHYGITAQQLQQAAAEGLVAARILLQEKGAYRVALAADDGVAEKAAEISGKFRYQALTAADFPAVGDYVLVDANPHGDAAIIHRLLPRRSCFIRKAAGDARKEQVVAANVDTLFLCMSLNNDFSLRRLERYLSIGWESGALPVIVLTKSDLCRDLADKLMAVEDIAVGVDILLTSALETDGWKALLPYLREGRTAAFIGSSGVGKSTLINCLLGGELLATGGLRNDDKGRHTTTHRQLMLLPGGGMVIDTPGMRELGMWDAAEGIDRTFADVEALTQNCRFADCSHSGEPGCAVQAALDAGELAEERWLSYQKLKAENAYAEDSESYLIAKERKFKDIAKQVKQLKKR